MRASFSLSESEKACVCVFESDSHAGIMSKAEIDTSIERKENVFVCACVCLNE